MAMTAEQKTVVRLVGVAVMMGGLAWASVPFYDWFCRVTGFGGTTAQATRGSDVVLDRDIKVRFDGTVERGLDWTFKPVERVMKLKIGETGLAFYEAHNPTDAPIAGSASFNVFPYEAGGHFTKIDCFCFEQQVLAPGETVLMPVSFYVDPEITQDRDAAHINSITLSYTFHRIDLPEGYAALDTGGAGSDAQTNLN